MLIKISRRFYIKESKPWVSGLGEGSEAACHAELKWECQFQIHTIEKINK
jgi:hypothetical protein